MIANYSKSSIAAIAVIITSAIILSSCRTQPLKATETADIKQWAIQYTFASPDYSDVYRSDDNVSWGLNAYVHPVNLIGKARFDSSAFNLDRPEKSPKIESEVEDALKATLPSWLINQDVLNMVQIHNPNSGGRSAWRCSGREFTPSYWFSLAFQVEKVRILVTGSPEHRRTETCLIAVYSDAFGFEELAHRYLNIPDKSNSEPDYRPIRLRYPAFGSPRPLPDVDWDFVGQVIEFESSGLIGEVRSTTRLYGYEDEKTVDRDLSTIDFSLSY